MASTFGTDDLGSFCQSARLIGPIAGHEVERRPSATTPSLHLDSKPSSVDEGLNTSVRERPLVTRPVLVADGVGERPPSGDYLRVVAAKSRELSSDRRAG